MNNFYLGIDLGATTVKTGCVSQDGKILSEGKNNCHELLLSTIPDTHQRVIEWIGLSKDREQIFIQCITNHTDLLYHLNFDNLILQDWPLVCSRHPTPMLESVHLSLIG